MSVKKYHAPYKVKHSQDYRNLLRERSLKPVIKSICSKDSFDRDQLIKKLPLKSLEGFYLSRVFDSSDRDFPHAYCIKRGVEMMDRIETHELAYFKDKEKPHIIFEIENWCKNRINFGGENKSFQLVCLICENIIHWQKKSRWDLNAPKDKAEDFIVESLEGFLYDWLRCISNDKEDINVIRDPIKLEKALSKLRSKAVNHDEMIQVTHFYLSLFIDLKFLTLLEGEGFSHSVYISAKKVRSPKSTIMPTNSSNRYILGAFNWTIHQDTSVVPFFTFDLKDVIDQQTFWNVIRRNGKKDDKERYSYYDLLYHKFVAFSPTKQKPCPEGLLSACTWAFLCILPIKYPSSIPFITEYGIKGHIEHPHRYVRIWRSDRELDRASHLFYVLNFHYQEFLDLAALDGYDSEINGKKYCIDGRTFMDYYSSMEKSDEHAYLFGNLGENEDPAH
jgi:hypothetical protein